MPRDDAASKPVGSRPQRRDATANRARILDVAEALCDTEGLDVGFHRIASEAGVGVGTVYRHFPDRDALLLGMYERYRQRTDELAAGMRELPEGLARVDAFIDGTIAFSMRRPVARRVSARVRESHPEQIRPTGWEEEIAAAVRVAQDAGELRADADVTDIAVLAGMLADLASIEEPRRSVVLPRMRAYVRDALRPEGQARPPLGSEALSFADIIALSHQPGRA